MATIVTIYQWKVCWCDPVLHNMCSNNYYNWTSTFSELITYFTLDAKPDLVSILKRVVKERNLI